MGGKVGSALIFALWNLISLYRVGALRYEIESGKSMCVAEEIQMYYMSVGEYSVVDPTSEEHRISVRVTSPYENRAGYMGQLHLAEEVESGKFAFTATLPGDYLTCFWLSKTQDPPIRVTVDFNWRSGVSTSNWNSVAKKGNIDALEMQLKRMQDIAKYIHDEMISLREREQEMHELNRKVNSRMAKLSFMSFIVIVSVVSLQLLYLKNFFEKKKIV